MCFSDLYAATAYQSTSLIRLTLSFPPKQLPACFGGVLASVAASFSMLTAFNELIIAVVSCFVDIVLDTSEMLRLVPPCSPLLSRSFLILSRSSNDSFSHSAAE